MIKDGLLIRLFGGLFMTKHSGNWHISLGKLSFWIVLTPAIVVWCQNIWSEPIRDISANHIQMIFVLTAYNLGKKVTDVVKTAMDKKNGNGKSED
jgi:hypothetical protein